VNKLGFGFLHLPMIEGTKEVDIEACKVLVDRFLTLGGRYFDTAYTYLGGQSEIALREALVKRHPRDSFAICDKLPGYKVKTPEDCERYFAEQLERCGVEKFDVFMLHWLNRENYAIAEQFDEFGFLRAVKARGQADKIGFSYHDSPELLDEILTAHPCVDVVLLQINYLDWRSPTLQAKELYEVVEKHGKELVVMEPVKGGTLAKLPEDAAAKLAAADPSVSPAGWAIRFAQSLPRVDIVLSGMNDVAQIEENLRDVPPLTESETAALMDVAASMRQSIAIACTGCGYCAPHCPNEIAIPQYFSLYNEYARAPGDGWKMEHIYHKHAEGHGKASDCVGYGACEAHCPQKLPIIETMAKVAKAFG